MVNYSMKKILLFIFLFSACTKDMKLRVGSPIGAELMSTVPPGPEAFQKGWKDGCESAISSVFGAIYKTQYSYKMNYELFKSDPDYNIGRTEATWFCERYAERYNNLGAPGYTFL